MRPYIRRTKMNKPYQPTVEPNSKSVKDVVLESTLAYGHIQVVLFSQRSLRVSNVTSSMTALQMVLKMSL